MKRVMAVACVLCVAAGARAQEKVPPEMAQRFAKLFVGEAAKETDVPFKADVDPTRAVAIKKDDAHAMVIPAKDLSEAGLDKAGSEIVPVGQLWLRHLVPNLDGKRTPEDQLRIVHVKVNDEDHPLPMLLLSVRKGAGGPELVVYGKGKEALAHLVLKKTDAKQDEPIDLGAKDVQDETGTLVVTILGKWQAALPVVHAEK
jgi:hypothetical protein